MKRMVQNNFSSPFMAKHNITGTCLKWLSTFTLCTCSIMCTSTLCKYMYFGSIHFVYMYPCINIPHWKRLGILLWSCQLDQRFCHMQLNRNFAYKEFLWFLVFKIFKSLWFELNVFIDESDKIKKKNQLNVWHTWRCCYCFRAPLPCSLACCCSRISRCPWS